MGVNLFAPRPTTAEGEYFARRTADCVRANAGRSTPSSTSDLEMRAQEPAMNLSTCVPKADARFLSSGIARRDATTCSRCTAMVRLFRRWRSHPLSRI
jgi:hypothetical protein